MQSILGTHYKVSEKDRRIGEELFKKGVLDMNVEELKAELEGGED